MTNYEWLKRRIEEVHRDPTSECIDWPFSGTGRHGQLRVKGKVVYAHRTAYELYWNEAPRGWVLHKCNNSSCINPLHLADGSPRENIIDMLNSKPDAKTCQFCKFWQYIRSLHPYGKCIVIQVEGETIDEPMAVIESFEEADLITLPKFYCGLFSHD